MLPEWNSLRIEQLRTTSWWSPQIGRGWFSFRDVHERARGGQIERVDLSLNESYTPATSVTRPVVTLPSRLTLAGYSRKAGVRLNDAPSDWKGKVDVKVTAVEFADKSGN